MGFDLKYGKVTTERVGGDIPEDEIVVVLRGRDALVPALMDYYARIAASQGSPDGHVNLIRDTRESVLEWQDAHSDRVIIPTSETFLKSRE
jgi:hypothetical protein